MSPRAAWRLDALGFADVAHYAGGVADWMASGLPIEGTLADDLHVAAVARPDAPTCAPGETIAQVRDRLRETDWDTCFVVNEQRVLMGRVGPRELREADPNAPTEEAMRPGPVTYRPDFQADKLLDVMEQRDIAVMPVTTSEGVLVGAVRREDLQRAVERPQARARDVAQSAGAS
jgi:Mg/Co/Ni transporter MgtE